MPPSKEHASAFSEEHSTSRSSSEQPQGNHQRGQTPLPIGARGEAVHFCYAKAIINPFSEILHCVVPC